MPSPLPGTVAARELTAATGEAVPIPDPERLVHLQLRRFAGCPICNLHLRSVAARHAEIEAAGVREVVVFHAPADELRPHVEDLPFAAIPDPDRALYREFGVESSPRALLDPRVWGTIVRSVAAGLRRGDRKPAARPHGGRLGLPGDVLIAPDGAVLAAKIGAHAGDQWTVDELLARARLPRPVR
ncbi:peroxiredoxin-like family protein [Actinomadura parmotrematis]|uniref:AhpC/TSA family protein n=1 Tax=Actinomadura parmotrematis TaxID=2864039 RepID=A0ABS7G112_9ACTN|nr:peroxiredoxin-like family protein [Actinomadura parmotrematis]MBW8486176.1 AhpC/TSA family protein [Actinomadura parmotrematis]